MEAIVLVGGRGTRLRPLTVTVPKPMLPTAGVPFLAHLFARARAAGVTRIVLATCYRSETFEESFGDGAGLGLELEYVREDEPLGTGGGIRNAASWLRSGPDEPVLVLNGDILSGHDLGAQLALHLSSDADVTLHLTEVPEPGRFGCVPTEPSGRVAAFLEKTQRPVTNRINAGCYIFRRSVLSEIPAGRAVSAERETFPALIERGARLMAYADDAYWLDVGTPSTFVRGSCDLVLGCLESPALPGRPGEALLLPGSSVAPDAVVCGGSAVGQGSVVGPGARVEGSVVFDDVEVGPGARVRGSALARGARVGDETVLDGAVVGEGSVIGPGNELRHGARVWPDVTLPAGAIRFSSDL
ncbi:MAG: NTP transferase domain-containing protein [Streptosporangiales bacterium]|nr:NTP transferase domain-containing protein [Streptosporangiales bacterium]